MEWKYVEFENTIKKKHSFAWTPKFEESFYTRLNKTVFFPVVRQVFEKLDWVQVYRDETILEAKRIGNWNNFTEKITVTYDHGKVYIKSESLGNEFWDLGRNSKRVMLFINVFKETENDLDKQALSAIEEETLKESNWDNYVIPESLPPPPEQSKPKIAIPVVGGIALSILLGFLVAFVTFQAKYVILLFEVLVGISIGFAFKYLIRFGNFTDFKKLLYILGGVVLLTYIFNQYFLYQLIWSANAYEPIGFGGFMTLRFKEGLTIDSWNTGGIGLVISWLLQLAVSYVIAYLKVVYSLVAYQAERVPEAVRDFAFYHFVKDKTEVQVRAELSNMGWGEVRDQDAVFESIQAIYDEMELNR